MMESVFSTARGFVGSCEIVRIVRIAWIARIVRIVWFQELTTMSWPMGMRCLN